MSVGNGHNNVDSDNNSSVSVVINNDVTWMMKEICWK